MEEEKRKTKRPPFLSAAYLVWFFSIAYGLVGLWIAPGLGNLIPDRVNSLWAERIVSGESRLIVVGLVIAAIAGSAAILMGSRKRYGLILFMAVVLTIWQYISMVLQPIMAQQNPGDLDIALGFEPTGIIALVVIGPVIAFICCMPAIFARDTYTKFNSGKTEQA